MILYDGMINIQYQKSKYSSLEIDIISNNGDKRMNEIDIDGYDSHY